MSIAGGSVIRYRFKNARESEGAALTFAGAGLAVEALEGARRRSAHPSGNILPPPATPPLAARRFYFRDYTNKLCLNCFGLIGLRRK